MHSLDEVSENPLGTSPGVAGSVPPVPVLAGDRVCPFVDDRVVAVALLGDVASHLTLAPVNSTLTSVRLEISAAYEVAVDS